MTNLTIKAVKLPGRTQEIMVEGCTTVEEVLNLAGITVESEQEIKFNGESVTAGTTLTENGTLIVSKRIKGNR